MLYPVRLADHRCELWVYFGPAYLIRAQCRGRGRRRGRGRLRGAMARALLAPLLITVLLITSTMSTIADRAAGAVLGALIGDALGLGPHWYYDLNELRRGYGDWINGYTDPKPGRYHAGLRAGQLDQ